MILIKYRNINTLTSCVYFLALSILLSAIRDAEREHKEVKIATSVYTESEILTPVPKLYGLNLIHCVYVVFPFLEV